MRELSISLTIVLLFLLHELLARECNIKSLFVPCGDVLECCTVGGVVFYGVLPASCGVMLQTCHLFVIVAVVFLCLLLSSNRLMSLLKYRL